MQLPPSSLMPFHQSTGKGKYQISQKWRHITRSTNEEAWNTDGIYTETAGDQAFPC